MTQQTVQLNYLHIAPRKVRLIANALKGLSVQEAEAQLLLRPQRSAKPLLKLLRSASANIKNNQKNNPDNFLIASIRVNDGPMLKRILPRAMGRATPIHKKMSHVVLVLEESPTAVAPRFAIIPPIKKAKPDDKSKKKSVKPKGISDQSEKSKQREKSGFFKKMFTRKSV